MNKTPHAYVDPTHKNIQVTSGLSKSKCSRSFMLYLFSNMFWIYLPAVLQKKISEIYSIIFGHRFSRFFIKPYCFVFKLNKRYLKNFEPQSRAKKYSTFSDFFRRRYVLLPKFESSYIWACEGYVCDWGWFKDKNNSRVKGLQIKLDNIFASSSHETTDHFFVNIFLHNHNYHRIHAPVEGQVAKITRIAGHLLFLRPWLYKKMYASYPATKNERVIFELLDNSGKKWFLALVGGFGVGTIEVQKGVAVGSFIKLGDELGHFNLGSTVCIAAPFEIQVNEYLQTVKLGDSLMIQNLNTEIEKPQHDESSLTQPTQ
jgi:phosphatidylserine decarboxylase